MTEIHKTLREWACYFNIPFGTFKNWAYQMSKKAPFYESDARIIAAYGAGKSTKARGSSALAGRKNYTQIMEKLNND